MKRLLVGFALGLSLVTAQAQRAAQPTPLSAEELCRREAARGITSTHADLAPGEVRATVAEFEVRQRLCRKQAADADEVKLLSHRHYRAKDGHEAHSPAKTVHGEVPAGASAKCRDGSYSFSQHRRGTCSHHGGVGTWL